MSGITKRIAAAVEKSSLSYEEIEKELELPEGTVKKWLGGKEEPDTATVKRLAPLLGVSADHILFGVEKIGEMKAMFPNDVNPSPTPMSDWRFLSGVIMVFVGVVAIMMMVMRYAGEGIGLRELFEISAIPLIIFGIISVVGFAICIITSVTALHIPKEKKNKEDKNEK
ncbi:MAG: helix-turn-helix transcriptional regulator [Ruminococcaceae bacterium]|nr:helix-turn-helix transcriptional regulator [Oscillospiraceae bacterium]